MCLAVPAKLTALHDDDMATVEIGGVSKRISLALIDGAEIGDYVIVHTGFALSRLDAAEARKTLELFAQIASTIEPAP